MFRVIFVLGIFAVLSSAGEKCQNGGEIFVNGILVEERVHIQNLHNDIRLKVANGQVEGQPRGINLKRISYDDALEVIAKNVSSNCVLKSVHASSAKYGQLGQNLYATWGSKKLPQNWTDTVNAWYGNRIHYNFTEISEEGDTKKLAYTQLVWANTTNIGCNFVQFYDAAEPKNPYVNLYTCLYGPAGNVIGQKPYITGVSGCENLC